MEMSDNFIEDVWCVLMTKQETLEEDAHMAFSVAVDSGSALDHSSFCW